MTAQRDVVVLVDEHDRQTGTADKLDAHRSGALHRAISIFITNNRGDMLLQQRAADKYHSGGLWSNACCSHPMPDEPTITAAHRRMREELGIDTVLTPVRQLIYRATVTAELTEHEYDHIYTGTWDGEVLPAPEEVSDYQWLAPHALDQWLQNEPAAFTAWFPILLRAWRAGTGAAHALPA